MDQDQARPRILFVDDEPNVLKAIERMLRGMRQEWEMHFMSDPRLALALLERQPCQVVVSDMRMPQLDGSQLLAEVMRRHPHTVRIVLSGHSDPETSIEALPVTHQMLAKPCDPAVLRATIRRALALEEFLTGETPLRALISRLETLPSLPELYQRLVRELQSADASLKSITAIVAEDPAMAAKLLQLINSAFFGLRRQVSRLDQAVGLLGLDTLKALVLTAQVFAQFDTQAIGTFPIDGLWQHSTRVGALARRIMEAEAGDEPQVNEALLGGLLHDIGKLILAANLPNIYHKVPTLAQEDDLPLVEAETRLLEAAHPAVGAYLLGLWGLPLPLVEAVAFHHQPRNSHDQTLAALTAVHAANALSHEFGYNPRLSTPTPLDGDYLAALGLEGRVEEWRRIARDMLS